MLDFFMIATRGVKRGVIEVYPKFIVKKSSDLMIRGSDFYAVWDAERNTWSTDENRVIELVDHAMDIFAEELREKTTDEVVIAHMWDSSYTTIDSWHKYCQRQMRDSFTPLDEKLIFSNTTVNKDDFSSKRLDYPLEKGSFPSYEKLISTLYDPEERHKLEWAIGAIVTGDSKTIQKFIVLYGSAGTGKSTVLNIIEMLFKGYYSTFDAKSLGSSNNAFALEAFKTNPLVAIQHDGDLSRIEDNTKLNSLVSHELMTVNEKFKSAYNSRFISFLFMGTNKPVKITDSKSGLIRRLIDVRPSGNKLPPDEYDLCMAQIPFELGPIAWHCKEVYLQNPKYYSRYVPTDMMRASNDFYNFMVEASITISKTEGNISVEQLWRMYREYCENAKVPYPMTKRGFVEEATTYFDTYTSNGLNGDLIGLKKDRFKSSREDKTIPTPIIDFTETKSLLDDILKNDPAQYANPEGTPLKNWDNVKTTLEALDTRRLHYVLVSDIHHIVIDFDIPDENGNKCFEKNLAAASKFPPTYAELSKSGQGIHLHYIYDGDPMKLSAIYDDHIEVKVFSGKLSLRRKLSKCNSLPIAHISSGLPIKEDSKVIDFDIVRNEKQIRTMIEKNLAKEYHPNTKPSVDFIKKILDDAYASGFSYDVSDMQPLIFAFAASSTNSSKICIRLVNEMKFKSPDIEERDLPPDPEDIPIVFFDVEVFPNLLLVNWKYAGIGKNIVRMINPSPDDISEFCQARLIGFNNRRYDNHIIYARMLGWSNEEIYDLSRKITNSKKGQNQNLFFREAYNLSYTDIYDFASAGNKKSLKKLEIEMGNQTEESLRKKGFNDEQIQLIMAGTHHQELGLPWDQPVPEDKWEKVAEYCDNDVIATEAAFHYLSADWTARQILADLADMTENASTNALTARIIFEGNKAPQEFFNWRDMSQPCKINEHERAFLKRACPEMMAKPHGDAKSDLPYFPGYEYKSGKSRYRGEEVSEGGYVYAEPGIHQNVALLDISSMHPHSAIAEVVFGVYYTTRFRDIVEGRVDIKHEDWDAIKDILGGKLVKYAERVKNGELTSKDLANGLKTAINAVYGQTYAGYENPFRDPRNIDNIIAKRGALFMVDLKHAVQERGFTVAHIKTDSIKIPNATPEIIAFVNEFGKRYGYSFEHEATYERMCLVNDAVYIAKYATVDECVKLYGREYVESDRSVVADCKKKGGQWTATGTQFQVPYVFKTLFSKEPIEFADMCETKSASTALYLDMNEDLPDVSGAEKELEKLTQKINKQPDGPTQVQMARRDDLNLEIEKGHNYIFIGKVGLFCPIIPGAGGGRLMREAGPGKYANAGGASDFRWLETDMVKRLGFEDKVDKRYYQKLVDGAVDTISKYGDFSWFVSDDTDEPPWFQADEPWTEKPDDIFNKR